MEPDLEKDDDIIETESKIGDLLKVDKPTDEQVKELNDLKAHRKQRFQEKINQSHKAKMEATARAEKAEAELERMRKEREDKEFAKEEPDGDENETTTINGKKFYTDEAIALRVQSGKMTQSAGWAMQKEMIRQEAVEEMKKEKNVEDNKKVYEDTREAVLKEYPQFSDKHPDHDPNDPLFKEASRIWNNGYNNNPRGLKLALDDAKRMLGRDVEKPDLSEDFSVDRNSASGTQGKREVKTELSDWETQNAVRIYHIGGMKNPKTGLIYTKEEAVQKAIKAKTERSAAMASRR